MTEARFDNNFARLIAAAREFTFPRERLGCAFFPAPTMRVTKAWDRELLMYARDVCARECRTARFT